MKLGNVLKDVVGVFGAVKMTGRKTDAKLAALDRGVLEVAVMVAALEGGIRPEEYAAYETLAKTCRGYSAKNAQACLDRALHRAGYLMAISQVGAYSEGDRIDAFVNLALEALPMGFSCGSLVDIRRAFALWVAMGVADGSFSPFERRAIELLSDQFAEIKKASAAMFVDCGGAACAKLMDKKTLALFEPDFLDKAEKIVRDLGTPAKHDAALKALTALVEMR